MNAVPPSLWTNRNYRSLFAASAATNLGDGLIAIALPWLATLLTRDPLLIGLVAMARHMPWFLFALPVGVLTDRFDHRRTLIAADGLRVGLALAVVALALSGQKGTGAVLLLAGLAFLLGAVEVLRDNTAQTFLPALVGRDQLEQANGLLWSTEQVAGQFIGPPLAGVLIGFAIALPFGAQAAVLALAMALVTTITLPRSARGAPQAFGPALKEGLAWLWAHPVLRRLALALGVFNFAGGMFWAFIVLYAQDVLGLDATGYGLLMAAVAGGGLAGSLIGPAILRRTGAKAGLLMGLSGHVAAALTMGVSQSVWLVGAMLMVNAFTALLWNITTVSYRQRHIPGPLLGRVNAAYRFFGTGPEGFGALAGGVLVGVAAPLGPVMALQSLYLASAAAVALTAVYITRHLNIQT
jgi:fucose permease